jgi:FliI/YscN family ATPase
MLERLLARSQTAPVHTPTGVVLEVVGMIVEVGGLRAAVGQTLLISSHTEKPLEVEVVGFRNGRLLTTPLGPLDGIRPGAPVSTTSRGATVPVGPHLLGRVVDAFGQPVDGLGIPSTDRSVPLRAPPPSPFARRPIEDHFVTGVRAIDGVLPMGVGQRMGIFAGTGVGKSTLLGMICRSSNADVNVIALIGERGRELNDFIRNSLGQEGLARSVVVSATSDQPPLVRARGAETATAIAEYYRDQGKSVLLMMDSVTRYAMALREAALAAGEPPATKGYPPSVFAALPRLLERAGTCGGAGVITALYARRARALPGDRRACQHLASSDRDFFRQRAPGGRCHPRPDGRLSRSLGPDPGGCLRAGKRPARGRGNRGCPADRRLLASAFDRQEQPAGDPRPHVRARAFFPTKVSAARRNRREVVHERPPEKSAKDSGNP